MIKIVNDRPLPLRLIVAYFEQTNSRRFAPPPITPDRPSFLYSIAAVFFLWLLLYYGII